MLLLLREKKMLSLVKLLFKGLHAIIYFFFLNAQNILGLN